MENKRFYFKYIDLSKYKKTQFVSSESEHFIDELDCINAYNKMQKDDKFQITSGIIMEE